MSTYDFITELFVEFKLLRMGDENSMFTHNQATRRTIKCWGRRKGDRLLFEHIE